MRSSVKCDKKGPRSTSEGKRRATKYGGAQEGDQHREAKQFVADILKKSKDVSEVRIDRFLVDRINPMRRRRPDILGIFPARKVAFEIQASSTFLSVIVGRQNHYRDNEVYLIWVLTSFSTKGEEQTFTQKDICYDNSRCVFVLNEEAKRKSISAGELILACHYQVAHGTAITWKKEYVRLKDLVFDAQNYKIYRRGSQRTTLP